MTEPFCYRISRCGDCECSLGKVGNTVMVLCQNPPKAGAVASAYVPFATPSNPLPASPVVGDN